MKDRIRELWAQCVIKHTKTPMNWQDVADEFAELIVRECAEFARQHNLEKADRSHMIHKAIKEHFGVGE